MNGEDSSLISYFYENSFSPFVALSDRNSIFPGKHLARATIYQELKKLADEVNDSPCKSYQMRMQIEIFGELMAIVNQQQAQYPAKFLNRAWLKKLSG